MIKLGISAFYHDSAASIVVDGKVLAAAEEERFTGIKHDSSFPKNAIKYCLAEAGFNFSNINEVHWYENPDKKDDRVKTIFNKRPFRTFFLRQRYNKNKKINSPKNLLKSIGYSGKIIYHDHHYSHAAFSYYTSSFRDAAILSIDGVGEWETATISFGKDNKINKLYSLNFPHSLGMLYSTVTSFLGFKPNEGEYKVMGLAPYGNPIKYYEKLNVIFNDSKEEIYLYQKYFAWEYSERIMFTKRLCQLLELPPRLPEDTLTQDHKDLAAALQKLYENKFELLLKKAKELTGSSNICITGGCAYNGVANVLAYKYFDSVHVPFAPSDAGSAIGACLDSHIEISPYLGPSYKNRWIKLLLEKGKHRLKFFKLKEDSLIKNVSELIATQKIVAWYQGRMEFGARALGNRSILASPKDPKMRERLNQIIKKREGFRPFAPSIPLEEAANFFDVKEPVPYMNIVVKTKVKNIPSATHIDGTSRVQTVTEESNSLYYKLIKEVGRITGVPVILNTSFNLKDQTITLTPAQALKRFLESDIDVLVLNNFLIFKK
jgi:carbamoyltransferase